MSEEDEYINRHKKRFKQKMLRPLMVLVPEVGIEPTRTRSPEDFESSASTSFTTPASGCNYSEMGCLVNIITLNLLVKRCLSSSCLFRAEETLDGGNPSAQCFRFSWGTLMRKVILLIFFKVAAK